MTKSIRHKKCVNDLDCQMCKWHDAFKVVVQQLIDQGCPIANAQFKWYDNDRHVHIDGKFNTDIESRVYGDSPLEGRHEETFTNITTYSRSTYRKASL